MEAARSDANAARHSTSANLAGDGEGWCSYTPLIVIMLLLAIVLHITNANFTKVCNKLQVKVYVPPLPRPADRLTAALEDSTQRRTTPSNRRVRWTDKSFRTIP